MSLNDRDNDGVDDNLPISWMRGAVARSRDEEPRPNSVAIYARYSTNGQKETSVERQVELSREYAERIGHTVVAVFVDRAQSSMTECRNGLEAMMDAAARREFSKLVVENVDRLARDLSILSTAFRKLEALGIEMHDPSRGRLTINDIAIQGLMGETGRRLLLDRTSFSRTLMAREGRVPWGRCFGYVLIPGRPGELAIDEGQAKTVRLVFHLYLEGLNPPSIIKVLNERAIASAKSTRGWSETSVRILLNNPLYSGTMVYGRNACTKNPHTKRTTRKARPRENWIVRPVPHLRIVSPEDWRLVQARLASRSRPGEEPVRQGRRSKLLLARRVHCPGCGEVMNIAYHGEERARFSCPGHTHYRTCDHATQVRADLLENAVLDAIGSRLLVPEFVRDYAAAYNEARAETDREHAVRRQELRRAVADSTRRLLNTFDAALTAGFTSGTLASLRMDLEKKVQEAEVALAGMPSAPAWATIDDERMTSLSEAIQSLTRSSPFQATDEAGLRFAATFREIVERVDILEMDDGGGSFRATLRMSGLYAASGVMGPDISPLTIEGRYLKPGRVRRNFGQTVVGRSALDRYAAGDFAPTAAEIAAVAALVGPGYQFRDGLTRPVGPERFVEILFLVGFAGLPWVALPGHLGSAEGWRRRFSTLRRQGILERVLSGLRNRDGDRFGETFIENVGRTIDTRPPAVRAASGS